MGDCVMIGTHQVKIEKWDGHNIRFVYDDDTNEFWAYMDDICTALDLSVTETAVRLAPNMTKRIGDILAVSELGIYDSLFLSKKLDAISFRHWSSTFVKRMRKLMGLSSYEAFRMTEKDIQDDIDSMLDTLYWDEEQGRLMRSVTIQGGDVEQVPVED